MRCLTDHSLICTQCKLVVPDFDYVTSTKSFQEEYMLNPSFEPEIPQITVDPFLSEHFTPVLSTDNSETGHDPLDTYTYSLSTNDSSKRDITELELNSLPNSKRKLCDLQELSSNKSLSNDTNDALKPLPLSIIGSFSPAKGDSSINSDSNSSDNNNNNNNNNDNDDDEEEEEEEKEEQEEQAIWDQFTDLPPTPKYTEWDILNGINSHMYQHIVVIIGNSIYSECSTYIHQLFQPESPILNKELFLIHPYTFYTFADYFHYQHADELIPTNIYKFINHIHSMHCLQTCYSFNIDCHPDKFVLPANKYIPLSGTWSNPLCSRCQHPYDKKKFDNSIEKHMIPTCELCNGYIQPGIRFPDDKLDPRLVERMKEDMEDIDLLLILGCDMNNNLQFILNNFTQNISRLFMTDQLVSFVGQNMYRDVICAHDCNHVLTEFMVKSGWFSKEQVKECTSQSFLHLIDCLYKALEQEKLNTSYNTIDTRDSNSDDSSNNTDENEDEESDNSDNSDNSDEQNHTSHPLLISSSSSTSVPGIQINPINHRTLIPSQHQLVEDVDIDDYSTIKAQFFEVPSPINPSIKETSLLLNSLSPSNNIHTNHTSVPVSLDSSSLSSLSSLSQVNPSLNKTTLSLINNTSIPSLSSSNTTSRNINSSITTNTDRNNHSSSSSSPSVSLFTSPQHILSSIPKENNLQSLSDLYTSKNTLSSSLLQPLLHPVATAISLSHELDSSSSLQNTNNIQNKHTLLNSSSSIDPSSHSLESSITQPLSLSSLTILPTTATTTLSSTSSLSKRSETPMWIIENQTLPREKYNPYDSLHI
ncbi:hypothetical protein WA158_008353 [Blastocystis sp. Blastoise]